MSKILTILIPTYNMEKLLDKCLTSLIVDDQELLRLLEVLVVIDGAKDRSSQIAHYYETKYPETFRVIDKENGNYGSCVNRGLKEASGKYIKVLDADDTFDTDSFIRYLNELKKLDVDIVINNYTIVNEKGQAVSKHELDLKEAIKYAQQDILPYFTQRYLAMHEVAYRVSLLREHNYVQTEGVSYTDQEWVLFPVAWAKTAAYIKVNLYLYLIGREGQTVSGDAAIRNIKHIELRILNTIKLYNEYKDKYSLSGKYLKKRIISETERVYLRYIYIGRRFLDYKDLHAFDQELKRINEDIYNTLGDEKLLGFIPLRYIKSWRERNYNKLKIFNHLIDILLTYKNINFKIKSSLAK